MNDPLRIDQAGGFRNAVYGMIVALIVQALGLIWWAGQTEAHFDARISALEHQVSVSQTVMDKLNDAREAAEVHFAQVDGHLNNMDSKVDTILEIVQQQDGGMQNSAPSNFHSPSQPHQESGGR